MKTPRIDEHSMMNWEFANEMAQGFFDRLEMPIQRLFARGLWVAFKEDKHPDGISLGEMCVSISEIWRLSYLEFDELDFDEEEDYIDWN